MPLNRSDRAFLQRVDRFKLYVLVIAVGVFFYLLIVPSNEIQMVTAVIGMALCGIFWLTQKLLSFIGELDSELTRVVNAVKSTLTEEQRHQLFPERR